MGEPPSSCLVQLTLRELPLGCRVPSSLGGLGFPKIPQEQKNSEEIKMCSSLVSQSRSNSLQTFSLQCECRVRRFCSFEISLLLSSWFLRLRVKTFTGVLFMNYTRMEVDE